MLSNVAKALAFTLGFIFTVQALSAQHTFPVLRDARNTALQVQLEKRLKRLNLDAAVHDGELAVALVDVTDPQHPQLAQVNGDDMMYAASLPKIAILLGAYASFEDGSLLETEAVHQDLGNMIRVSSNSAASRLIEQVGMQKIQSVLKDPQYGFYDERRGGGLWIGRLYAKHGPRIGDPLNNISHGASATQVCRFFYLLSSGRLINPQRSGQMLADLSHPALHHKFVSQVDVRAPGARLFRKSGTWRQWHSDAIMVHGTLWRDYILVGLIESENGESILRRVLPAVEELIVPPEYAASLNDL